MIASTFIRTIYLNVENLDKLGDFYQRIIGLQRIRSEKGQLYLGVDETVLLVLQQKEGWQSASRSEGLYHFAIRVPTRQALSLSLRHLLTTSTHLQGASDHIVSEALYLADPEGNGIEIYRDRPYKQWFQEGEMRMATLPLDIGHLMAEQMDNPVFEGLASGTDIGHLHLHVADIARTEAFYAGLLGMKVVFNWNTATFLAYEGYHHHIGANLWGGRQARPEQALGLDAYSMYVPRHVYQTLEQDGTLMDGERGAMLYGPIGFPIYVSPMD
ncbi:VOC family protein [Anaerolineales bacterium]